MINDGNWIISSAYNVIYVTTYNIAYIQFIFKYKFQKYFYETLRIAGVMSYFVHIYEYEMNG